MTKGPQPPGTARPKIHRDALHRYLWRQADAHHRLVLHVGELADRLGLRYERVDQAIIGMRNEGRITPIGWKHPHVRIYEISDPDAWDRDDPATHRAPRAKPIWG